MAHGKTPQPMRIKLCDDARLRLEGSCQKFCSQEFDFELSAFQARRLIDFFVSQLGAPVYNQAIQDARSYLQSKLDDLEGEFFEPEAPRE